MNPIESAEWIIVWQSSHLWSSPYILLRTVVGKGVSDQSIADDSATTIILLICGRTTAMAKPAHCSHFIGMTCPSAHIYHFRFVSMVSHFSVRLGGDLADRRPPRTATQRSSKISCCQLPRVLIFPSWNSLLLLLLLLLLLIFSWAGCEKEKKEIFCCVNILL